MIFRLIKLENPWSNSNGVLVRIAALKGNLTADERQRCQMHDVRMRCNYEKFWFMSAHTH